MSQLDDQLAELLQREQDAWNEYLRVVRNAKLDGQDYNEIEPQAWARLQEERRETRRRRRELERATRARIEAAA